MNHAFQTYYLNIFQFKYIISISSAGDQQFLLSGRLRAHIIYTEKFTGYKKHTLYILNPNSCSYHLVAQNK